MEPENTPILIPDNAESLYFNGFSLAVGTGDVVISLLKNGKQSLVLNTSYTVAKTLSEALTGAISELEQKTDNKIMTVNDVATCLQKNQ